jgi:hypothetical protein
MASQGSNQDAAAQGSNEAAATSHSVQMQDNEIVEPSPMTPDMPPGGASMDQKISTQEMQWRR